MADPIERVADGDILLRLRRTRATLPELSPQDRTCRDAALEIEALRSDLALMRRVVVDLWDHMDEQACIEFSVIRPRSHLIADAQWQSERERREATASSTSSPQGGEADHG